MTNKISYIIGFRAANSERIQGLLFVLKKLRAYFADLEIIVIEQDEVQRMEFAKELKIKHLFFENSGLYNRSKAFNIAVQHSDKDAYVFADSDMFFAKEDYLTCFAALQKFEAVTPNKSELLNIAVSGGNPNEIEVLSIVPYPTFAGGVMILTRAGFEKIGGWDERFIGWGGEDNAMDQLIYQKLTSKAFAHKFYHIDHPRSTVDTNKHPQYHLNHKLSETIKTYHGQTLERYIQFLKNQRKNASSKQKNKQAKFVFAVTTYNRLAYLKELFTSFFATRNTTVNWDIIVADDGSTDGSLEFLKELQLQHKITIIRNQRVDITRQTNTILKTLSTRTFDFCFKCDDDIVFKKADWDMAYWEAAQRYGYPHLIFYDKNWRPANNLERPVLLGDLVSNCPPENIQGALYTLTPEIIEDIGFFDEQRLGRRGMEHIDYSFRCCRAGFNLLKNPFDLQGSNDFISLQGEGDYTSSVSSQEKSLFVSKESAAFKRNLIQLPRTYIPYNENFFSLEDALQSEARISKKIKPVRTTGNYPKADATYYSDRGISGLLGFVIKRFYNLCIDLRLYFIPKAIKSFGKFLNKISIGLIDIEK